METLSSRVVAPEPSFSIVGADALVSPYTPIYSWERFNWCMAGAPSSELAFLAPPCGRHLEETNSRAPTQGSGAELDYQAPADDCCILSPEENDK